MRLDEVTMLLAMGVFLLHAPPSVVRIPALQYPCVNEFTTCLQADSVQVGRGYGGVRRRGVEGEGCSGVDESFKWCSV